MGKSTAAGFFLQLGVRIVDTDELAHQLVEPGEPALVEIQNAFGGGLVPADGRLDREELARLVFANAGARKKLEAILHPRIRERWEAQVQSWRREDCPVAMVVIPLLYETAAEKSFDRIVCVACTPRGQQERLRARGWPPEQVRGRVAAQMAIDQKIGRADFVVWTEGSLASHQRQVAEIMKRI
jgi:dephospho-CoA kinase